MPGQKERAIPSHTDEGTPRGPVRDSALALLESLALTSGAILFLQILSTTPFNLATPDDLLLLVVAFAAFRKGLLAGLTSALLAGSYVTVLHMPLFGTGSVLAEPLGHTALPGLTLVAMAILVGGMRRRLEHSRRRERALEAGAERGNRRLSGVLESMSDGFLALDREWRITAINTQAEQLLNGGEKAPLLGRVLWHAHPDLSERFRRAVRNALTRRAAAEFEEAHTAVARWLDVRVYPAADGVSIYLSDITGAKQARNEILFHARLLDAIGQSVIGVDLEGTIIYCNDTAAALLGRTVSDLRGRPLEELQARAEDGPTGVRALHDRIQRGESWSGELLLQRRDGSGVPVIATDSPIRNDRGNLLGMVRVAADFSEQKWAERAQRLLAEAGVALSASLDYESTIKSFAWLCTQWLADACIVDLPEGSGIIRLLDVAHAVPGREEQLRDVRRRQRISAQSHHPVAEVMRSGEAKIITPASRVEAGTGADAGFWEGFDTLGTAAMMIVPLMVRGQALGAISLIRDDPAAPFEERDQELARELARRAATAIDHARVHMAAIAANQAKTNFLAVMSHELRTPLTTIMGYADLMLTGLAEPLTEKARGYVERVRAAAVHLLSLIEQILIYARLDAGREELRPERLDLARLLRDTAALIEPVAAERGLEFKVQPPPYPVLLSTDGTKLRQILLNLLANAVKFTDRGEVSLSALDLGDEVQFQVRDTGIGIDAGFLDRVFDPFWQVDQSDTRQAGGTGLGLSVAQRLARFLGGEVTARSAPGVGSTFTLRVPKQRAAGVRSQESLLLQSAGAARLGASAATGEAASVREAREVASTLDRTAAGAGKRGPIDAPGRDR